MPAAPPFLARFRHPAQVVVAGFGLAIGIGTTLLSLPIATTSGESAGWVAAVFTAAVLFEAISAFGTAGLSTGITASMGTAGHLLLAVLMFVGRIGPLTLGSALALNSRSRHYELPEERVIVG